MDGFKFAAIEAEMIFFTSSQMSHFIASEVSMSQMHELDRLRRLIHAYGCGSPLSEAIKFHLHILTSFNMSKTCTLNRARQCSSLSISLISYAKFSGEKPLRTDTCKIRKYRNDNRLNL